MGVYDEDRALALELIREFGEVCTFSQTGDSEPVNPNKPWELPDNPPVLYTDISIAFFPMGSEDLKSVQHIFKDDIPTSLEKAYMQPVSFNPALKDLVIRSDGSKFRIVSIGPLNPNGEGSIMCQLVVQR